MYKILCNLNDTHLSVKEIEHEREKERERERKRGGPKKRAWRQKVAEYRN